MGMHALWRAEYHFALLTFGDNISHKQRVLKIPGNIFTHYYGEELEQLSHNFACLQLRPTWFVLGSK